jgi:Restriction endonuclease
VARIEKDHLRDLLAPGDIDDASTTERGQALEHAVRYAFEQIPGVTCRMQDVMTVFRTEEIDLLFSAIPHDDGIGHVEPELLVECKNWSKVVGAEEVNWFATKLRRRNRSFGVLVAAQGVTGDPLERTAALQEVTLALHDHQEVVVLTREELENLDSGEQLAALLLKKRDYLVGRMDLYVASAQELRSGTRQFRRGWGAFRELMRAERNRLIEEAMQNRPQLPDDDTAAARRVDDALDAVDREVARVQADPQSDPTWAGVRDELLRLASVCVAWVSALGWQSADGIRQNLALSGFEQIRVNVGSRQWECFARYYAGELARDDREGTAETALFALLCMAIEMMWRIDDYTPEPEDYAYPGEA